MEGRETHGKVVVGQCSGPLIKALLRGAKCANAIVLVALVRCTAIAGSSGKSFVDIRCELHKSIL